MCRLPQAKFSCLFFVLFTSVLGTGIPQHAFKQLEFVLQRDAMVSMRRQAATTAGNH